MYTKFNTILPFQLKSLQKIQSFLRLPHKSNVITSRLILGVAESSEISILTHLQCIHKYRKQTYKVLHFLMVRSKSRQNASIIFKVEFISRKKEGLELCVVFNKHICCPSFLAFFPLPSGVHRTHFGLSLLAFERLTQPPDWPVEPHATITITQV